MVELLDNWLLKLSQMAKIDLDRVRNVIISERKKKKITQTQMALRMGILQPSYNQKETGKSQMTLEELNQICDILDISPIEVLIKADDSVQFISTNDIQKIKDELDKLLQ